MISSGALSMQLAILETMKRLLLCFCFTLSDKKCSIQTVSLEKVSIILKHVKEFTQKLSLFSVIVT